MKKFFSLQLLYSKFTVPPRFQFPGQLKIKQNLRCFSPVIAIVFIIFKSFGLFF